MQNKTTEFSFILRSSNHGVGVFAIQDIKEKTYLRLFGNEPEIRDGGSNIRKKEDVPEILQQYCIFRKDYLICPRDFGHMSFGWYINHSKTPNAYHHNYLYYALRDIKAGEEITIDYNSLEEPEEVKEYYY